MPWVQFLGCVHIVGSFNSNGSMRLNPVEALFRHDLSVWSPSTLTQSPLPSLSSHESLMGTLLSLGCVSKWIQSPNVFGSWQRGYMDTWIASFSSEYLCHVLKVTKEQVRLVHCPGVSAHLCKQQPNRVWQTSMEGVEFPCSFGISKASINTTWTGVQSPDRGGNWHKAN